jgi:hypothetical protein
VAQPLLGRYARQSRLLAISAAGRCGGVVIKPWKLVSVGMHWHPLSRPSFRTADVDAVIRTRKRERQSEQRIKTSTKQVRASALSKEKQ